jgi:D-alanyl-D-alanine carboxypeptidase
MKQIIDQTTDRQLLLIGIILIMIVGGVGIYRVNQLEATINEQKVSYTASTTQLQNEKAELQEQLSGMQDKVTSLNEELEEAEEELEEEQERNDELEERVEEVTDSIGTLERTVETEPELLKKYSRTFFLSENYKPESLEEIDEEYLAEGDENLTVDERVWPYLEDLLEEAEDDGIDLRVTSAYRPFGEQAQLNDRYTRVFGTGANQFSAEQGYSEHQLGTTIDFVVEGSNTLSTQFADTEAFEWLQDNAHDYGFTLSYPEGNRFYQFEPWHWRFVGEELAQDLKEEGDYLYDWSQREIDTYRAEMFD